MRRLPFWLLFVVGLCIGVGFANVQSLTHFPSFGAVIAQAAEPFGKTKLQPFNEAIKGTQKLDGLFTLYRDRETGSIYAEIQPEQLNKNYLSTVTLESGIGERGIYSGMPLGDYLFYFRRIHNNLHFTVRNVNFRGRAGDPIQNSIKRSFSDSTLYSLKIISIHPQRKSVLVDMGELLLQDFAGVTPLLSWVLETPYGLDRDKTYFDSAKTFPLNVEIETVYGFSSGGGGGGTLPAYLPTLPDSRALTLRVHHSLSELPNNNGYRARLADNRVGYFITAYQDFSSDSQKEPFVRYINRWRLEKQDPKAPLSPPKQPIVFWIENSVPLEYREAIREGVLMWNQAFEGAGFKDAIEVRQMPKDANWDPADVRYNTIRWLTSYDGAFAMGPSRVNPITGEILDADIVIDANLVRAIKQDYRSLITSNQSQAFLAGLIENQNLCTYGLQPRYAPQKNQTLVELAPTEKMTYFSHLMRDNDVCYGIAAAEQFSVGTLALSMFQNAMPSGAEMQEYVRQYLSHVVAHEVGHTLGLRHNFLGSTLLEPQELHNPAITRTKGLASSVMDYIPTNLAPQGVKQGDYFPMVVGPYDKWAIAYGYTPSDAATTQAEVRFLRDIAQRSPEPDLAYATDEDAFDFLDPTINRFDLSGDVLEYSQWQMKNAQQMWTRLNKRYPIQGESYSEVRDLFDQVLAYYFQYAYFTTKYVGGQSFRRDHANGQKGRLPFEPIPLEKQRQALGTLQQYIFAEDALQFPPELLNKLAPSRWSHWGTPVLVFPLDYPIHDRISFMQRVMLRLMLSNTRLTRLRDMEMKTKPGQVLTMPELFETLEQGIWKEVLQPDSKAVQISSLRRALQQEYVDLLSEMVLRTANVPDDARTLAWYQLRQLHNSLGSASGREAGDTYTKAHLEQTRDRIAKTLNAQLRSQ